MGSTISKILQPENTLVLSSEDAIIHHETQNEYSKYIMRHFRTHDEMSFA